MSKVSILSETRCHLGEGPFYCERRDTLFWFDIVERKRYAHNFSDGTETVKPLPEMASAMAVVDDHHDLIFTASGLWLCDSRNGAWSPIASIEADSPVTRSNDARVHPCGAFWLGTMGRNAEKGAGKIYRFFRGRLDVLYDDITIPNAICFSPDGKTAYWTDTDKALLMRVNVDPETGAPTADPQILVDHRGGTGGLDGAICDGNGNIWNARWGASAVDCYNPDGTLLQTIEMPASQPSCPAFVSGGRIAVTSAWQNMDKTAKAADPHAGKTFLFDAGVSPRFEPFVKL